MDPNSWLNKTIHIQTYLNWSSRVKVSMKFLSSSGTCITFTLFFFFHTLRFVHVLFRCSPPLNCVDYARDSMCLKTACKCTHPPVRFSVCPSVCLSIYKSIYLDYLFTRCIHLLDKSTVCACARMRALVRVYICYFLFINCLFFFLSTGHYIFYKLYCDHTNLYFL